MDRLETQPVHFPSGGSRTETCVKMDRLETQPVHFPSGGSKIGGRLIAAPTQADPPTVGAIINRPFLLSAPSSYLHI